MTILEVKKGMLLQMQKILPKSKYKYYAKAVVEEYQRPSFFTQIVPLQMEPENYNSRSNVATFYIAYMQESADEADALEVIQRIRDTFGLYVMVGNRAVKITDFEYSFAGTERNIPEITMNLEWMDRIEHKETDQVMESLILKRKMKEEK